MECDVNTKNVPQIFGDVQPDGMMGIIKSFHAKFSRTKTLHEMTVHRKGEHAYARQVRDC